MCSICNQLGLSSAFAKAIPTDSFANATPGASGVGDSLYPGFGNGGYDAQRYIVDLNITDVPTSTMSAVTTMEAIATQNLSSFNLDFIGFTINGITVNGKSANFTRDGQELTITPSEFLAAGQPFSVDVSYSGAPSPLNSVAFDFPVPTGWVIAEGGNFVLSEPDGAANYYPVNDHPLDRAAYKFRITVPEPFEVAANGVLEQTIDNGDTITYIFEARDPMVSYLTTVNIYNGFDLETSTTANGVPIRNYFANDIPKEKLELFGLQPAMIDFFSQIYGDYPFELYGAVVVNIETGSALETQTLSIFGVDTLEREDLEETIAHEASHQWFGDSVALSDWKDIWLNESFATYSQGLWVEYSKGGKPALDQWVKDQYNFVSRRFDSLVIPGAPPANDLFNSAVYEWGALGLHAVRLDIGDDAFFASLKTYYERYKGSNVKPEDFISVVAEVSQQDVQPLFDRWIYSDTLASIPELGLFAGTLGDDTLFGTSADETYSGLNGNDIIYGNGGMDKLFGNSGDDLIYGGAQADRILGGTGNDTIYANGGGDFVDSGAGSDLIWLGGAATVVLAAGEGYDTVKGFQLGTTQFQIGSTETLSFMDSGEGAQIFQGEDLLAVVTWQSASVLSGNVAQIFTVA
jgi:Peptidase family M1 domain/RTX calcium-binding nonapeptide repeat (4 copies)/Peptidase M1 N-terminal domain